MELDVHLVRSTGEPWGFRLVGGSDYEMPITVVKVMENSPADCAGLQHGDLVTSINDAAAAGMTHEDSRRSVAAAADTLVLGVARGLYDPVLDDQEYLLEDLEDFDQPSRPTEVSTPESDPPAADKDIFPIIDKDAFENSLLDNHLRGSIDRSLTASPFLVPTKPFRPFSTEPVEVPPVENPIILNSDYEDIFKKFVDEDFLPKTRFKLPISDQYDPDGTKQKNCYQGEVQIEAKLGSVVATEEIKTETSFASKKEQSTNISSSKDVTTTGVKFLEQKKQDMDFDKIEVTASNVVEESIVKAVSVAEVIKEEIDVELNSVSNSEKVCSLSEIKSEVNKGVSFTKTTEQSVSVESKKAAIEVKEMVELIDKATEELIKKSENKSDTQVKQEIKEIEAVVDQEVVDRRSYLKENIEELVEKGNVKRKSLAFENEEIESKAQNKTSVAEDEVKEKKATIRKTVNEVDNNEATSKTVKSEAKTIKSDQSQTKTTSRLLSEQRAYTIGLQTIPNIRGTTHSSYHYNLLLKTFFIHLTDVMVALSRFILAEPILSNDSEAVETKTENTLTERIIVDQKEDKVGIEMAKRQGKDVMVQKRNENSNINIVNKEEVIEEKFATKQEIKADAKVVEEKTSVNGMLTAKQEIKTEQKVDFQASQSTEVESSGSTEKRKSGAKMSQLVEKKSEDLTCKMDAVITEFQNKAGVEEIHVTDDVSEKNVQTEIHAQMISSEVSKNMGTVISEFQTKAGIEEVSTKESKQEVNEVLSNSSEGTNTYIAIVEAHVYTNKDAILNENVQEMSTKVTETASKSNLALESSEAVTTEIVALQDKKMEKEVAKTVIEKAAELTEAKTDDFFRIVDHSEQHRIEESTKAQSVEGVKSAINKEIKAIIQDEDPHIVKKEILSKVGDENTHIVKKETIPEVDANATVRHDPIASKTVSISTTEKLTSCKTETDLKIAEEKAEIKTSEVCNESLCRNNENIPAKVNTDVSVTDQAYKVVETAKISSLATNNENAVSESEKVVKSAMKSALKVATEITEMKSSESKDNNMSSIEMTTKTESVKGTIQEQSLNQEILEAQESKFVTKSEIKEACFVSNSNSGYNRDKLTLDINQAVIQTATENDENNNTPTPEMVPPTPLTDEYMFQLQIPFPRGVTPIPPDLTPEDEDPHIVKKKLVPHIDTKVEDSIIYDPPLSSPPLSPPACKVRPFYTKPGLRGGSDREEVQVKKEEILEIERKSSLLASAIDETIKSIEEYKEEVGIESSKAEIMDTIENPSTGNPDSENNGRSKIIEIKMDTKEDQESSVKNSNISGIVEEVIVSKTEASTNTHAVELSEQSVNFSAISNEVPSETKSEIKFEVTDIKKVLDSVTSQTELTKDPLDGYRPVPFDPEEIQKNLRPQQFTYLQDTSNQQPKEMYKTPTGELIGTHQGIVDGLEEAVVDAEIAKEMGKPGMTEEKIAELISGESEMLREAHVMGLSRVLTSHMHRADDDSSVDFKKIKPLVESLKDSEVLRALNEELLRHAEEKKKKEERKYTTFLQKPKRAVPKSKFGYYKNDEPEEIQEPYKVKIVKQPKPKVAPDYKPKDFNTGLLPWEERALREPTPPPVAPEDPILIPEEAPEILEAVDPLPESEVPDLEDSGIQLPEEPEVEDSEQPQHIEEEEILEELDLDAVIEETEKIVEEQLVEEMDQSNLAEQLMMSVQNMVDPSAPLDQQLAQMRAQLAALAQLPCVIQQSLELVTKQLCQLAQLETSVKQQSAAESETVTEETQETPVPQPSEVEETEAPLEVQSEEQAEQNGVEEKAPTSEELEFMRRQEEAMMEEQRRIEKQKKVLMEQARVEHESRLVKQHPTPRVGKPKPVFGPPEPVARPIVLSGGRKWRKPQDAYNEQLFSETLAAQAEVIQGKAKGFLFESPLLPYDKRINFMKYEKPPVSLDHLQKSDVYKMIHGMEQAPGKRVEMLNTVIAESDYREKCRSISPCTARMALEEHTDIPQQVQP